MIIWSAATSCNIQVNIPKYVNMAYYVNKNTKLDPPPQQKKKKEAWFMIAYGGCEMASTYHEHEKEWYISIYIPS